MHEALGRLVDLLRLEEVEPDRFRGRNEDRGPMRLFGGQVAAQALAAAGRTVKERRAHSLHGYFLRPGDPDLPVVYDVHRIRDGSSFTTRRVVARQHEKAIFNMSASFHEPEPSYEHQDDMPDAPPPEGLPTWEERARELGARVPEPLRSWLARPRAIEMRSTQAHSWFGGEPNRSPNLVWLRAPSPLPDDPLLHQCLLTYASDMGLVDNIYRPHRKRRRDVMMASLDHAVWFHRPLRVDDWILYVQESPTAFGARGFVHGALYARQGARIGSVAQEGLMRRTDPKRAAPAPSRGDL